MKRTFIPVVRKDSGRKYKCSACGSTSPLLTHGTSLEKWKRAHLCMPQIALVADPLFESDVYTATYKRVEMTLAVGRGWMSIYSCESKNPGHGEVQEMINIIKRHAKGKKLYGSVPLGPIMRHIYDKKGIIYREGKNVDT